MIMFNTDKSYVYHNNNKDTLIISFAGFYKNSIFDWKMLLNYDVDVLFLRDISMSWYLCGIKDVSNDVRTTLEFIKVYSDRYKRIVTIGSSMGGFGSLLYGSLLDSEVYMFSPQIDISSDSITSNRWTHKLVSENVYPYIKYHDKCYLKLHNMVIPEHVTLYYGKHHIYDNKLKDLIKCNSISVDTDEHSVAMFLKSCDKLNDIIKCMAVLLV